MDALVLPALLFIHVGGAIIGFGPTFAFSVLGPAAGKAGPNGGAAILGTIVAIEDRFVKPVALVLQPLSGIALIFVAGYATDFFRHYWLIAALILYVAALYIAFMVNFPAIHRMLELARSGPPTPEMAALAQRTARMGPILTVLLSLIILLMVTKPLG